MSARAPTPTRRRTASSSLTPRNSSPNGSANGWSKRREGGSRDRRSRTVGAVCLDATGLLAAATSTGGLDGQRPGRVGDSPLTGAGTWADERVAVSCAGQGETFIRAGAARLVAALVEHGATLEAAANAAMARSQVRGDGRLDRGRRAGKRRDADVDRRDASRRMAGRGKYRRRRCPNTIDA